MQSSKHLKKVRTLINNRQFHEAIKAADKLCKRYPGDANAWAVAGIAQQQSGDMERAIHHYQKAIEINPDLFEPRAYLANYFLQESMLDAAVHHLQHVTRIKPSLPNAWCNLGLAYTGLARSESAIKCYQNAMQLSPDSAHIHVMLGNSYATSGYYDDALKYLQKARTLDAGNIEAIASEASVLMHIGQHQRAWDLIQPIIEAGSNNIAIAIVYANLSKRFNVEKKCIQHLQQLIGTTDITGMQRMEIYFSLGSLCDSTCDYEKAFHYFQQANQLASRSYDADKDRIRADHTISFYSKELLERFHGYGNTAEKPIFIIGMPRSGTSLIERILSRHPEVHGAGELTQMMDIARDAPDLMGHDPDPDRIDELAQRYLDYLSNLKSGGASYITDKMPHNFLHLGLIHILFPNAKIIHCKREPLDTCLSCYFQHFNGRNDYAYGLGSLGHHYRQYRRYMAHWRDLDIPMFEIQYEDMVSHQERYTRELLDYCGLEWDDVCSTFHESKEITHTSSYDQVRQPIYSTSVDRWKNYEKDISILIEALRQE